MFKNCTECRDRMGLAELLVRRGLTGKGAEIGVWRGDFSHGFMERWPGSMYLVDPWAKLEDYDDVRNVDFDAGDYNFVQQRFREFGDRVTLVRELSEDATVIVPSQLDFVYIDANHAYGHVLQDLSLWWPKVVSGGVLAGHDIFSLSHPGVTQAVMEFGMSMQLPIHLVNGDYRNDVLVNAHSYYMIKP